MSSSIVEGFLWGFATVALVTWLAGCATISPDLANQMTGVATALETLPAVPADAATQAQVAGWTAWASFLLKAAAVAF